MSTHVHIPSALEGAKGNSADCCRCNKTKVGTSLSKTILRVDVVGLVVLPSNIHLFRELLERVVLFIRRIRDQVFKTRSRHECVLVNCFAKGVITIRVDQNQKL